MSRWVVITGIILGIILLFGLVFFLISRLFNTGDTAPSPTPTTQIIIVSPTPAPTSVTRPAVTPAPAPPQVNPPPPVMPSPTLVPLASPTPIPVKVYNGLGFVISYPAHWGILTCANSPNFEFDPDNSVDQLGVICNVATKPISVILDTSLNGCVGQQIQLGNIGVVKGTTGSTPFTQYQWCTQTSPVLRITHRVASNPSRAVGTVDRSAEIENIISNIQFNTSQVSNR